MGTTAWTAGFAVAVGTLAAACRPVAAPTTPPASTVIAILGVGDERFRIRLTTDAQVRAARAAQAGGPARIPNGRLVAGADANVGWSWHLEDVEFAEVAIEVCDGRPSEVEHAGVSFGGGRYCPWSATVIDVKP